MTTSTHLSNTNELKVVATINEEIKAIVHFADEISLTATNAILLSRHGGSRVTGFRVMSNELRSLSLRMSMLMQDMAPLVYGLVVLSGRRRHRTRSLAHLHQAGQLGARAKLKLAHALSALENEMDGVINTLSKDVRALRSMLKKADNYCASGRIMARSGAIEAAYGGPMVQRLTAITQEVDGVLKKIEASIRMVESQLDRGEA